jgi:hypothetical protein
MDYISKCFVNEENINIVINSANSLNVLLNVNTNSGWPSSLY